MKTTMTGHGARPPMMLWLSALLLVLLSAAASTARGAADTAPGFVARLTIDAPIGPAAAEYYSDASQQAVADGAQAIVLQLDTPGGLSESMRQIIAGILASKIPVLGYVAPSGARAASAGTYILYACHLAAMAPATHLGAATPVSLSGGTVTPLPDATEGKPEGTDNKAPAAKDRDTAADGGGAEGRKVLNDAIAYIRSLAQLRQRNADWAESAVRGAATLTASEAAKQQVIDFVAGDVTDVLAQADGRSVRLGDAEQMLRLKGLAVRDYAPNWRTRFLAIITNPTIAYILLLAGIYGLVLEAFHPGALLPGIVGGICLVIGAYALQLLPVNYAGLVLMALGVALVIGEALSPGIGALGIGGIIAFVIGSIMLLNTHVPGYAINLGVIIGIATVAGGLLALLLWLVMRSRRGAPVIGPDQMLGLRGELIDAVAAGGEAWARVRGERWRIRSAQPLPAGSRVRVLRRDGLLLWVEPE